MDLFRIRLYLFFTILAFVTACSIGKKENTTSKKSRILKEAVLSKYSEKKDSLKAKSGIFLIINITSKYSLHGQRIKAYTDTILTHHQDDLTLEKKLNLMKYQFRNSLLSDLDSISSMDLMNNINLAYNAFTKYTWSNNFDFELFCEYILPYKIGNEPLENWREKVQELNYDSIFHFNSIQTSGEYVIKKISDRKRNFIIRWGNENPMIPDIPYSVLEKLNLGSCKELSDYATFVLRSYGIPVSKDFTPNYANINAGHNWNALIINKNKSIPFIIPVKDTLGYFKSEHYQLCKVYRKTYSIQEQSHAAINGPITFPSRILNDPCIVDVTDQYVNTFDIDVPIFFEIPKKAKFAYLEVFSNRTWVPVSWGEIHNNTITFRKMGAKTVYLPVVNDDDRMTNFNYPLKVDEKGNSSFLRPDTIKTVDMKILRKYPLFPRIQYYIDRMIGGEFQGANRKDFSDAVALYTIEKSPGEYFNTVSINAGKAFKYFRYVGPADSWCNIAEMEIYEDENSDKPLKGNIIATEGINVEFPERKKENVFDGDVLTFFQSARPDSCWVGLEFKNHQQIGKIRFIARTDLNIIVPGNEYELFYWNDDWISLGRRIASSNELIYKNVPSNALYFLQNHTKGKEERIFTYEDGKQIWW